MPQNMEDTWKTKFLFHTQNVDKHRRFRWLYGRWKRFCNFLKSIVNEELRTDYEDCSSWSRT